MTTFRLNQHVITKNGPGIVESFMWVAGYRFVVVRHILANMTGRGAGVCQTPNAHFSGLWSYEEKELEAVTK